MSQNGTSTDFKITGLYRFYSLLNNEKGRINIFLIEGMSLWPWKMFELPLLIHAVLHIKIIRIHGHIHNYAIFLLIDHLNKPYEKMYRNPYRFYFFTAA